MHKLENPVVATGYSVGGDFACAAHNPANKHLVELATTAARSSSELAVTEPYDRLKAIVAAGCFATLLAMWIDEEDTVEIEEVHYTAKRIVVLATVADYQDWYYLDGERVGSPEMDYEPGPAYRTDDYRAVEVAQNRNASPATPQDVVEFWEANDVLWGNGSL